ncbi:MAG: alkene reductase [Burkholderiales bacterium]
MLESLFSPLRVGGVTLRNRICMAPCSRHRAHLDGTPSAMMVEHYRQRASAGLIVAEATACSAMGTGFLFVPGIYTDAHVAGWRAVTDAVHAEGGAIFLQVEHVGRLSDPLLLPSGSLPFAPSAVQPDPTARHYTINCPRPKRVYGEPHAMTLAEIQSTIGEFAAASRRAREAGFDGVEVHAASGYLPMQFLSTNTNRRTDQYGGSVANRARFLLEVVEAMQAATAKSFVAVKIGPGWTYHDVFDEDPIATYSHVTAQLSSMDIAYLQVGNFNQDWDVTATMRRHFKGPLMGVKGFNRMDAGQAISNGLVDLVAYGQAFIANPDLIERFRKGLPLNVPDPETFYTQGVAGYNDYPLHSEADPANTVPVDSLFGASASGRAKRPQPVS